MYKIYTMFDENMQPLYVGCTNNIRKRMYSHKSNKSNLYGLCNYVS